MGGEVVGVGGRTRSLVEVSLAIAAEDIGANKLVNLYDNGGVLTARLADASTPYYAHGFTREAYLTGETAAVWHEGRMVNVTPGMTTGEYQYLSNTPGEFSATPGTNPQWVGLAADTDVMVMEIGAGGSGEAAINAHIAATIAHGTTSDIVGVDDTQTLTNKTIDQHDNPGLNVHRTTFEVRKGSVGSIAAMTPVYLSGYNPGGWYEVEAADADIPGQMPAIGLTDQAVDNTGNVQLVIFGEISGVDTSSYSVGDALYVASGGGLTTTRPTSGGTAVQKIAVVTRSNVTQGTLALAGAYRSNDVPNTLVVRDQIDLTTPNTAIVLDGALDSTGYICHRGRYGTLGETVAMGEVVYMSTDGKWYLADADAEATSKGMLYVAAAAGVLDDSVLLIRDGVIRNDAVLGTGHTVGVPVYLSLTAGAVTESVAAFLNPDVIRHVGYWESDGATLVVDPSGDRAVTSAT
jgi:hypothetical protein